MPFRQTAFYTGPQGARGKDATDRRAAAGHIVFRTTRPLPVAQRPDRRRGVAEGRRTPPTQTQRRSRGCEDNRALSPRAGGGSGAAALFRWPGLLVGRDPPRGTIIPLFAPPDGMSAAAVRYVENMAFDNRAFTAAIVDLGVNGHLKLTGTGGEAVISHDKGGKPLDAAEQAVETELFAKEATVRLDQSDHDVINDAEYKLWRTLAKTYNGKLFNNNYPVVVFRLLRHRRGDGRHRLCVPRYCGQRGPAMWRGMLIPLLPIMIGASLIHRGRRSGSTLRMLIGLGRACGRRRGRGSPSCRSMPASARRLSGHRALRAGAVTALGFSWLQAPHGRAARSWIRSRASQYLGVAEEDRLNALNPPEKTPELFERFLPYAIALDVENAWAKRFAGVLAAAAAAAAVATWYDGDRSSSPTIRSALPTSR